MWLKFFLLTTFLKLTTSNFTKTYEGLNIDYSTRQNRLLSFNTDERGDVSVELAFNVPFMKIPVKKSVDTVKGAVANVNVGAVALSGGLILATVGLFPAISWLLSKKSHGTQYTTYRSEFSDVEPAVCVQKVLCWSVRRALRRVKNGKGGSTDKIIDGVVNSEWLGFLVGGTALQAAIDNGMRGTNCAQEYSGCKIGKSDLELFTHDLFGDFE